MPQDDTMETNCAVLYLRSSARCMLKNANGQAKAFHLNLLKLTRTLTPCLHTQDSSPTQLGAPFVNTAGSPAPASAPRHDSDHVPYEGSAPSTPPRTSSPREEVAILPHRVCVSPTAVTASDFLLPPTLDAFVDSPEQELSLADFEAASPRWRTLMCSFKRITTAVQAALDQRGPGADSRTVIDGLPHAHGNLTPQQVNRLSQALRKKKAPSPAQGVPGA
ncbi:hypothetical protein JCM3770_007202 [Rhodotorula araucariae]